MEFWGGMLYIKKVNRFGFSNMSLEIIFDQIWPNWTVLNCLVTTVPRGTIWAKGKRLENKTGYFPDRNQLNIIASSDYIIVCKKADNSVELIRTVDAF